MVTHLHIEGHPVTDGDRERADAPDLQGNPIAPDRSSL
jgi:hypothetical protein